MLLRANRNCVGFQIQSFGLLLVRHLDFFGNESSSGEGEGNRFPVLVLGAKARQILFGGRLLYFISCGLFNLALPY